MILQTKITKITKNTKNVIRCTNQQIFLAKEYSVTNETSQLSLLSLTLPPVLTKIDAVVKLFWSILLYLVTPLLSIILSNENNFVYPVDKSMSIVT